MKIVILTAITISSLLMTSCRKESQYRCACYNTLNNTSDLIQVTARSESQARSICLTQWNSQNNSSADACDLVKTP